MQSTGRGRRLALWFGSFIFLVLGLLLIAPLFISVDFMKKEAIARIEQATGRDLEIRGDIGIRLFPHLQLNLGDVHLGNPAGFEALPEKDTIALQQLQLSLSVLELLKGHVAIDRLQLVDPVIYLARNAKGQGNWVFEPADAQTTPTTEAPERTASSGGTSPNISVPELEIVNGTIIYRESLIAEPQSLSRINARLKLPSFTAPAVLYADTLWNDDIPLKAELRVDTPAAWLEGKQTAYDIKLTADEDLLSLTANGKAFPQGENGSGNLSVQGESHLTIRSIKQLSARLGSPMMQTAPGDGKTSLRSMFSYDGERATLRGLTLSVDDITVSGSGGVDLSGSRPHIVADLSSENVLVLDSLLNKGEPTISRDAPAQSGSTPGNGWDTTPLLEDTDVLKTVNADIKLAVGGIKADRIEVGAIRLSAVLSNGALNLDIPEFPFYGGKAESRATVTITGKNSLRISKHASLAKADIGKFLHDAQGFDRLSGKGDLSANLTMQGASMHDFISSMSGTGSVAMQNGAIKGFDLVKLAREAKTLVQSVKDKAITAEMQGGDSSTEQTDFSSLTGSFTIAKGVVSNQDLALKAPLLNVTGQGMVNLPQKTVDYRLRPTVVGSAEGESRTDEARAGVAIPMRVTGTFDELKFRPDASGVVQDLVKDPKGTVKQLEDNVRGVRDDLKSLFKGL